MNLSILVLDCIISIESCLLPHPLPLGVRSGLLRPILQPTYSNLSRHLNNAVYNTFYFGRVKRTNPCRPDDCRISQSFSRGGQLPGFRQHREESSPFSVRERLTVDGNSLYQVWTATCLQKAKTRAVIKGKMGCPDSWDTHRHPLAIPT